MTEWALLGFKVVLAAFCVALLSHLSSAMKPKLFSGLFAGAPIVAAVSLAIATADRPQSVPVAATGMIAGALGMVACCALAAILLPRVGAIWASAAGWGAWAIAALAGLVVVAR